MSRPLNEQEQAGLEVLSDLIGPEFTGGVAERIERGGIGSELTRYGFATTFAQIWSREGLDKRSRSLVTIALLIARGGAEKELRNHFRIGQRNGLSLTELEEVIMHTQPYMGHTAALPAMEIFREYVEGLNKPG